mgnify:CR=1 FL=1
MIARRLLIAALAFVVTAAAHPADARNPKPAIDEIQVRSVLTDSGRLMEFTTGFVTVPL